MNAILVKSLRHHCVHEVNGHSSDVDYKSMLDIVCRYIFDYVPPTNSVDLVTPLSINVCGLRYTPVSNFPKSILLSTKSRIGKQSFISRPRVN